MEKSQLVAENPLTLVWVDGNMDSEKNQEYLKHLRAHPKIFCVKNCRTTQEVKEILNQNYLEIDVILSSGPLAKDMTQLVHTYENKPPIQIIIFSESVEYHKNWGISENIVRMVTDKFEDVLHLLHYFQRRQRLKGVPNEFIMPYEAFNNIETHVAMKFVHHLYFTKKFKYSKEEIRIGLELAAVRSAHKVYQGEESKEEKELYCQNDIKMALDRLEVYLEKDELLTGYTLESFIYRETNRRLQKYLKLIPPEALNKANEQLIREGEYDDKIFDKIKFIVPFAVMMVAEFVKYNNDEAELDKRVSGKTVYRGVYLSKEQIDHFAKVEGQIIGFPAFTSTSLHQAKATEFGDVLMIIDIPPIKDFPAHLFPIEMASFSKFKDEAEVLLPIASHLKVIGCTLGTDPSIHLQFIPQVFLDNPHFEETFKPNFWPLLPLEDRDDADVGLKEHEKLVFESLKMTDVEIQLFLELIHHTSTETELDFHDCHLGNEEAVLVGQALKLNKNWQLESLRMGGNKIGDMGGIEIGQALKYNQTLIELGLYGNQIGDSGARAFGEALKVNTTLKDLNLINNKIGDEGVNALGEGLKLNTTLEKLSLGRNQIGDEGGIALGEALKLNTTLENLSLLVNQIGDEGGIALGEGLKLNTSLTRLGLGGNQIGDKGAIGLIECLERNETLKHIGLVNTSISEELLSIIGSLITDI